MSLLIFSFVELLHDNLTDAGRLHDLRHTFVSLLIEAEISIV
jgi:hypothetical protein